MIKYLKASKQLILSDLKIKQFFSHFKILITCYSRRIKGLSGIQMTQWKKSWSQEMDILISN